MFRAVTYKTWGCNVGSEGQESKTGRGWGRKKPSVKAHVVINGEEADDKGPSSRCQPYDYTILNHIKDFVYNIKHNTHTEPFNTRGNISELLTFILENSTGKMEEEFVVS